MSWPTTRRFSRSLADAFPDERAGWLERPPRRADWWRIADAALLVLVGVAVLLTVFGVI